MKYKITGHEKFSLRYPWLPKAVMAVQADSRIFSDEDEAIVEMGMGKNTEIPMTSQTKISDLFQISGRFLRSVHLVRDFNDPDILKEYILSDYSGNCLRRISKDLESASGQRAWRITGDYGTGKSSFALFLAHWFAGRADDYPTDSGQRADYSLWCPTGFSDHAVSTSGLWLFTAKGSTRRKEHPICRVWSFAIGMSRKSFTGNLEKLDFDRVGKPDLVRKEDGSHDFSFQDVFNWEHHCK